MDSRGARWVAVGTAAAGASYLLFSLGDAIEQHLRQRKEQYEARQLFNKMDLDLDGTVTIDELRARLLSGDCSWPQHALCVKGRSSVLWSRRSPQRAAHLV